MALAGLGGTLLHLLWQGTLVGAAAAIALRVAGPAASRLRYRLALGALALIATAPLATAARQAGLLADWGLAASRTAARRSESRTPAEALAPLQANPTPVGQAPAEDRARLRGRSGLGDPLAWLGVLWLAGAAVLLARLVGGVNQVHRIRTGARMAPASLGDLARDLGRQMDEPRSVPVLLSDRADAPFATGIRRPAVLLPDGLAAALAPEQIRVVIAHELAHVQRHDYAVNLGQHLLEALFWFHPAVHWLSRVARDEREHCCDELAAEVVGDRRAVAGALLALEEARGARRSHALRPAAAGGSLLRRVERLIALAPSGRYRWAVAAAGVLLTGGGTMVLATPAPATSASSIARKEAAPVVWAGELRAGGRLRIRNLVGSIQVVRANGSTGIVRAHLPDAAPSDLIYQVTREADGVTVCALRAAYGRCDSEGYTWFGPPEELRRTRIQLTVELPPGVSVTAATFDGDLGLNGVDSDAEARTGSGAIAVRIVDRPDAHLNRTLELHTGAGSVRVILPPRFGGTLDARFPDGVRHTSLGPGGNRLRASSGSGDLVLSRG